MERRLAELPLHGGKAPSWLFQRMWRLAGAITMAVVDAYGPTEMLRRLADPWWFQAFGCVLGFDWHSSGLTTVTCGALKEAHRHFGPDLGILIAGGKGGTSRHAPREILDAAQRHAINGGDDLVHASRMSAKVDSAAVQDGYQVYHHSFFFSTSGSWCVVQQGMNKTAGWARRYHWLGKTVNDFVCEPHEAIVDAAASNRRGHPGANQLNMVAREAEANRRCSAELIRQNPDRVLDELAHITQGPSLFAPQRHSLLPQDVNGKRLGRIIRAAHERHPTDFHTLLDTRGVGPATIRSLSLLAELIYNAPACHRDPARTAASRDGRRWADYAWAHGGKDGTPFPVDRPTYDRNIALLTESIRHARVGRTEQTEALRRLAGVKSGRMPHL